MSIRHTTTKHLFKKKQTILLATVATQGWTRWCISAYGVAWETLLVIRASSIMGLLSNLNLE